MAYSIWWLRRDLRLKDNRALNAALAAGSVVPVFVLDPAAEGSRYHRGAERRKAFLHAGLKALDVELRKRGSRLVVRRGEPAAELSKLAGEVDATGVFAEEDYSPYARRRDARVAAGVPLTLLPGVSIRRPQEVLKQDGGAYTVFTPFARAWKALPLPDRRELLGAPASLPMVPDRVRSAVLPKAEPPAGFPAGPGEARKRLRRFSQGEDAAILDYAEGRNSLDSDGTSALSPYLRFGMLSAREAAVVALEAAEAGGEGPRVWLNELIWRDFYLSVLYHHPSVLRREFDAGLRGIAWQGDDGCFEAWKSGRTGIPVIDAAMRQLSATGWMHNRARMLVASFLVKNLLIDWRRGEQWFMDQLIDGDPAANNGGWQWTAGVGTDAAPYFRVFNPVLQGMKFDPNGDYVRRWVPELAGLETKYIHEPWTLPPLLQADAGVVIGRDYPAPIVDLSETRVRAIEAYQAARRA